MGGLSWGFSFVREIFEGLDEDVIFGALIVLGEYLRAFLEVKTGFSFRNDKALPEIGIFEHGVTQLSNWFLFLWRSFGLLFFTAAD